MSWVAVGVTGAGMIMGQQQAAQQRKAQRDQNNIAAAQTEFSPWTGVQGQASTEPTQSNFQGALGGGMQGLMAGNMMKGQMDKAATEKMLAEKQLGAAQVNQTVDPMEEQKKQMLMSSSNRG